LRYVVAIILLALLIYYFLKKRNAATQIYCTFQGNSATCMSTNCNITNDPATWPSGDRFWLISHAVGFAEGADKAGSNPDRLNNPGDISDGGGQFGFECHSGSNVTHFPDKTTGWQWLHDKIENAYNGTSREYFSTDTWTQIAQKWAGNWRPWLVKVTEVLGVSADSTMADYINE
jgi:hypothetical protein